MQSEKLATFLLDRGIESIVSSPFLRTIQSITPLAQKLNIEIKTDDRLVERVLSSENLPDWMEHLRMSFIELDNCLPGGESSREAMNRIVSVIDDLLATEFRNLVVVTHGNLMSLLLKYFDAGFGFERWQSLSNPDLYCLSVKGHSSQLERIWGC